MAEEAHGSFTPISCLTHSEEPGVKPPLDTLDVGRRVQAVVASLVEIRQQDMQEEAG